jgi:hypothetical protein
VPPGDEAADGDQRAAAPYEPEPPVDDGGADHREHRQEQQDADDGEPDRPRVGGHEAVEVGLEAARQLVEHLSRAGATIYVLHDFDKSGLTILHTLAHDTRRYRFSGRPSVVDLGLRLADVEQLGLPSEPVGYDSTVDPRHNLRRSGASEAECDFLVRGHGHGGWEGERVELNAMASDELIGWLEGKLAAHGVGKFVPGPRALAAAYRRAARLATLAEALDEIHDADADPVEVPADLEDRVRDAIAGTDRPWDAAVWDLARDGRREEGDAP